MMPTMKFLALLLLSISLAFGQAGPDAKNETSQPALADQDNSRRARALLDGMIQALGGQAYLDIQDISQEGRTYGFHLGLPEGVGVPFWRFYVFPDKERLELTKKRDWFVIYRGDQGFEITYQGTRSVDPKALSDYLRRRQYSLDWVVRKWLKEPGIALFYEGSAVAAEKEAQQVTIMDSQNQAVTLYVDAKTHLPIKKSYSWRDPVDKQRNVEEEIFDNYRPVQGIMTPFDITRYYNGDMSSQRFLTSVTYNKGLSDAMFAASITNDSKVIAPKK
jgi:hypothetical protein